jgi:post-segregation antitoxin (ccd killing protein)
VIHIDAEFDANLCYTVCMGPARSLIKIKKQRTTLTLPSDSLMKAKNIARARRVNLSTVISEALSEGLKTHAATERSEEVLALYRKAFAGFTDDELSLLDGIVLEPATRR